MPSTGFKAGVPIKVMSDRLGHATTAFTMDVYTHAIPAVEHEAAEQIADLVFGIGQVGEDDEPEPEHEPDADEGTSTETGE